MRRELVEIRCGLGFDTSSILSAEQYLAFASLGLSFCFRYLGDLTSEEVDGCLASGLALGVVQHAHKVGTELSAALGSQDGARAADDARRAELPEEMPLFCDLEDPATSTSVQDVLEYSDGWCAQVEHSGVYWGSGMPGNARDVYRLPFPRYWKSFSDVVTPWRRGYQLIQLFSFPHGDAKVRELFPDCPSSIADVRIDLDVASSDYLGSSPLMLKGA